MMSEFIKVDIDFSKCAGMEECGGCVRVCPVTIFKSEGSKPAVIRDNEDECILCDLCLESCTPGAIQITKLYETA